LPHEFGSLEFTCGRKACPNPSRFTSKAAIDLNLWFRAFLGASGWCAVVLRLRDGTST
jgi:hypothetical protein